MGKHLFSFFVCLETETTTVVQVFQAFMEHSHRFRQLEGEMMMAGSLGAGTQRLEMMVGNAEVDTFSKALQTKIKVAKGLRNVQTSEPDIKWSLVQNTGYHIKAGGESLETMASRIFHETMPHVLEARKKLLALKGWSELRTSLWLAVNEWHHWNKSGVNQIFFQYWDKIEEQLPKELKFYDEERAIRIQALYSEDLKKLQDLGDSLTTCKALCNNPDAPVAERVISAIEHEAIVNVLKVRSYCSSMDRGLQDHHPGCPGEDGPSKST